MDDILKKLKIALDRTVPIADPTYIIGEEENLGKFERIFESLDHRESGIIGCVLLGQIGNGKTHFLRYLRRFYVEKSAIGVYIPDMFVSGPIVDALNGIYKSLFNGPGNFMLDKYLADWEKWKKDNKEVEESSNTIIRYLLNCNNDIEEKLVLKYYSGVNLIPDEFKFLRNKFGLKKRLIENENDFQQITGDAVEFIYLATQKNILLLFDEVDKIYSYDSEKLTLSRVQSKILSAYRLLFDMMNNKNIKGLIVVGATPEAWDILSTQGAFERRFTDNKIILKAPKTVNDCIEFIKKRFEEISLGLITEEVGVIAKIIGDLPDGKRLTWAEIMRNIKNSNSVNTNTNIDPGNEILNILTCALGPLTWAEIVQKSLILRNVYPKNQPTPLIKKLERENKIKIIQTRPKSYEFVNGDIDNNDI